MPLLIRPMTPDEYPLLKDFLYEAVFQKHGPPLPRNIIQQPSLRIYTEDFGRRHGDLCLCADTGDLIVGAAWVRYMHGFGNVADVRENDEEYVMVYRFRRTSELRFSPFRHEFL